MKKTSIKKHNTGSRVSIFLSAVLVLILALSALPICIPANAALVTQPKNAPGVMYKVEITHDSKASGWNSASLKINYKYGDDSKQFDLKDEFAKGDTITKTFELWSKVPQSMRLYLDFGGGFNVRKHSGRIKFFANDVELMNEEYSAWSAPFNSSDKTMDFRIWGIQEISVISPDGASTVYPTVNEAWKQAIKTGGSTVQLLEDATARGSLETSGAINFDFNGHILTNAWALTTFIVKSGSEKDAVPLGTGPYFFLTDSDGPCLMRNDGWWYGEQLPLERIDLTPAKDADSAVYLFSAGRAHLLPADLLSEGTASGLNDVDIADAPTGTLLFLGFNTRREQTADRALRAAMDAAVDRDALVTTLLAGHAAAARFPISPASPLYPKEPAPAYGSDDYPGMLAALYAAPDTAEGDADAPAVELTLLANEENPFKVSLAEYLARELSKGPVSVTPVVLSWTEYLEALGSGEFDLWLGEVRLTADWNVAPLVGTGGALNYGGYSDPETDAAIRSFLADESAETSAALCARLAEESPILPLMFKAVSVLTPKGMVEGIAPTAANPFANLDRWSLRLPE